MTKHQDTNGIILVDSNSEFTLKDKKIPDYSSIRKQSEDYNISEEELHSIFEMGVQGMSCSSIADWLGISRKEFEKLIKKKPEISKIFLQGRSHGMKIATKRLFELLEIGSLDAIKYYIDAQRKLEKAADYLAEELSENIANDINKLLEKDNRSEKKNAALIFNDAINKILQK